MAPVLDGVAQQGRGGGVGGMARAESWLEVDLKLVAALKHGIAWVVVVDDVHTRACSGVRLGRRWRGFMWRWIPVGVKTGGSRVGGPKLCV